MRILWQIRGAAIKRRWQWYQTRRTSPWDSRFERGSYSYVLLVVTTLLLGMWSIVGYGICETTRTIQDEISNVGTSYGSERGVVWFLNYAKAGRDLDFYDLDVPDIPPYQIHIHRTTNEDGYRIYVIICYNTETQRASGRTVELTRRKVQGTWKVTLEKLYS